MMGSYIDFADKCIKVYCKRIKKSFIDHNKHYNFAKLISRINYTRRL